MEVNMPVVGHGGKREINRYVKKSDSIFGYYLCVEMYALC